MVATGFNVSLNIFLGNKPRWRALIHFGRNFKQNINLGLLLFRPSNFQLVVSPTCARKQLKSIPNPQGKENSKGNLMRRNEIGNQVLIFSKIILNNSSSFTFLPVTASPSSCLKMRCSYVFCVLFRGVARVNLAGIIRRVAQWGHGRDMQFFSWHAIFRATYGYVISTTSPE